MGKQMEAARRCLQSAGLSLAALDAEFIGAGGKFLRRIAWEAGEEFQIPSSKRDVQQRPCRSSELGDKPFGGDRVGPGKLGGSPRWIVVNSPFVSPSNAM